LHQLAGWSGPLLVPPLSAEAWSSSCDLLRLFWWLELLHFSVRNVLLQGITKCAIERCSFFCLFACRALAEGFECMGDVRGHTAP
jgi:hypothetical protein